MSVTAWGVEVQRTGGKVLKYVHISAAAGFLSFTQVEWTIGIVGTPRGGGVKGLRFLWLHLNDYNNL